MEIKVRVKRDGTVEIDAIGYAGSACETATQGLEQMLGITRTREYKPEYSVEAQSSRTE